MQDQLVIERHNPDGSSELVATWGNTPRGWELLLRRSELLKALHPDAKDFIVRVADPTDDITDTPHLAVTAILNR